VRRVGVSPDPHGNCSNSGISPSGTCAQGRRTQVNIWLLGTNSAVVETTCVKGERARGWVTPEHGGSTRRTKVPP
jgi:hypothetical protein